MSGDARHVPAGQPFELVVEHAPSGLVGTLGLRIISSSGLVVARSTAGIIEHPSLDGVYQAVRGPLTAQRVVALWDTDPAGVATPSNTAVEDIVIGGMQGDGIVAAPGDSYQATAANWPSGLVGTITAEVIDNQGVVTDPVSTAGIVEYPPGSGLYWATRTAPTDAGDYSVVINDGTPGPAHTSTTPLTVVTPPPSGGGGFGPGTMAGMEMPPYVSFCGTEIANAARWASYVEDSAVGSNIENVYNYLQNLPSILWRAAGATVFSDPVGDGAAWYDPSVPESAGFYGFVASDVEGMDTTETRQTTAAGTYRGGGILGSATLTEREVTINGWIAGARCDSLEYGRRWLADALSSGPGACSDCDLQIRLAAPPDDGSDDARGSWRLHRVALRSLQVTDPVGCCDLRQVKIVLVAGDPVLYKEPVTCQGPTVISPSSAPGSGACIPFDEWYCGTPLDPPVCCTVQPPVIGRIATIVTLTAVGEDFGGARITINPSCPAASGDVALAEVDVGPLPIGSSLSIDAAQKRVIYTDQAGVTWDGVPYLTLPAGRMVPWLEVDRQADPVCICAEPLAPCAGGYATFLTIQTQQWDK